MQFPVGSAAEASSPGYSGCIPGSHSMAVRFLPRLKDSYPVLADRSYSEG